VAVVGNLVANLGGSFTLFSIMAAVGNFYGNKKDTISIISNNKLIIEPIEMVARYF
jgi:hypothetical protein